jgi:acyl carrier protein
VGVAESLRRAIAKVCDLDPGAVRLDTKLSDLGVDSLAVAEIIVEVEIELDREFPVHILRRLDRIETVGDVAAELEDALRVPDDDRGAPSTGP